MIIRVVNRENKDITKIYYDVEGIRDHFNDNGTFCHQLELPKGETATFPACDWRVQEQKFVDIF